MNNYSKTKEYRYTQRIEYYYEILTFCKLSPKNMTYLMQMIEVTNSRNFHRYFDPLVKHGYLKKSDVDLFANIYTITQKGKDLLVYMEIIMQALREIEGENSGYSTHEELVKEDERVTNMFKPTKNRILKNNKIVKK